MLPNIAVNVKRSISNLLNAPSEQCTYCTLSRDPAGAMYEVEFRGQKDNSIKGYFPYALKYSPIYMYITLDLHIFVIYTFTNQLLRL